MRENLILIGGGGHAKSCIDVIEQEGKFHIAGIVDVTEKKGMEILGYPVIGSDAELPLIRREFQFFFVTIGQIRNVEIRTNLFKKLVNLNARIPTIVSPESYVSRHAVIGPGTIVMHGAFINAGASVGKNCIVNTKSLIEHDAVIESFCHISTGAIINGDAVIREKTFIGSNTMIKEGVEVGALSVIGGGMNIFSNVPEKSFLRSSPE